MTAYTPGLIVNPEEKIEKLRELALCGKVLVQAGDRVRYDSAVLSAEVPAEIIIIRLPDRTGIDISRISRGILCKVGDFVNKDELIFRLKTCFGLFTTTLRSPVSGTIEFFNPQTGHLGIRPPAEVRNIPAYISGTVTEVIENKSVKIETTGALIQGIFGLSGERFGKIVALDIENNAVVTKDYLEQQNISFKDAILVGGKTFSLDALNFAVEKQVSGIVTGSITSKTLNEFLGYKLGLAITGDEKIGLTLIITEGFGEIAISTRVMELARSLHGHVASINGATQVRAGAMRPELIVTEFTIVGARSTRPPEVVRPSTGRADLAPTIGGIIRITREPYFGQFARIVELPAELTTIETGAKVRVAKVELLDKTTSTQNRTVFIPRANLELC